MIYPTLAPIPCRVACLSPRRIAVFRALYLGDLLCATPAFRALRERFPMAEITLIGLPWAAEFVARSPHLDRFLAFPGYPGLEDEPGAPEGLEDFLGVARAAQYDLAIQMHGNGTTSNDVVAALGAGLTLGYRRGDEDRRIDRSLVYREDEHETQRWLRLVATLGAQTTDRRPVFHISRDEAAAASALLDTHPARSKRPDGPLLGLHVGAKDPARRWPAWRFAALGDLLWARHGAGLVLTGGAVERPVADAVSRDLRAPVLNLAGRTDLGHFAATIARLDLLVTNDTGASHLAAATGVPSVILFGPSRPERWAPLDRVRHLPVDARALVEDRVDGTRALRRLPVDHVLAACETLLRVHGARSSRQAAARARGGFGPVCSGAMEG